MGCVWLIAGPTASGKSALATALAQAMGGAVVNADSMQIYRDLRVLTARPSAEEEARVPHHLYGVADAADGWSVGRWLAAANAVLDQLDAEGRDAVVVGGTGLYFRALTQGLAEIPVVPDDVRDAAAERFDVEGETAFRQTLAAVDPAAQARIAPGDRQRLVRAMAVAQATGRALSDWQADTSPPRPRNWRKLVIDPPREALFARCDARFEAMVAQGALEEARTLLARKLDPGLPLMKAVGLREIGAYQADVLALDEAVALGAQETRRYAKRQTTWFRNQCADWPRLERFGEEADLGRLLAGLAPAGGETIEVGEGA